MLSNSEIDEFVAKHSDTTFLWGNENISPEKLAPLIRMVGILPCKDCKRFFESLDGSPYRDKEGNFTTPYVRVNNGECDCGRVCSVVEWNEEMMK